ncbi:hypothetical protein KAI56_04505 [Candidatus Parcubacteria bacterium]|nr:hypothetical protein [Candidatus Parcubacteria bacterium]
MIINKIKKLIGLEWIKDIYYSHIIIVDDKRCVIDKRIKNINIEGEKIDIGEKIVIYKKQWVEIVNAFPIKYSYRNSDEFEEKCLDEFLGGRMILDSKTIRAGDSCIIAIYGEIKVLGFVFNDNGDEKCTKILVSYNHAEYSYETCCPSHAEFLIEPEEFIHLRKTFQDNKRR